MKPFMFNWRDIVFFFAMLGALYAIKGVFGI
jgi:hypothetical protein